MEEILASIRRIIADDDTTKAAAKPAEPAKAPPPPPKAAEPPPKSPEPPKAAAPAAPPAAGPKNSQDDIDAMLAELDALPAAEPPPPPKVAAPPPPPPPPPAPKAPEPPEEEVLDLTESMATPEPIFRTIDGKSDLVFEERPEPPPRPAAPSMVDLARRQFEHELGGPALMSPGTSAAVDSAFNSLAHTVLSDNARTLEDLVKEMLRPMLKAWLDDNLPNMVERLIRAEIERVSRGRK
jgi:cell pole-organizing protein PopZ